MASKATKPTAKRRTYASAVAGVTEKSIFSSLAKCQLKRPKSMPNGRIPNTKEEYSFFIDLKSTNATEAEVLDAINIAGIVGANARDDLWVVEFVCENAAAVETAMNTVFTVEGKQSFEAIMPRHKANHHVLIKVVNVPFKKETEMCKALTTYWTQYGTVIDAAPYKFPGKPWLTKRWDILLQLNHGITKLEAPPAFSLDGIEDPLICSWIGSKKACLHCKSAGHSTSKCPVKYPKNQKVGGMANPLQKIGGVTQNQKRQKKEPEVSTGSTEKSKASTSSLEPATPQATQATSATQATVATQAVGSIPASEEMDTSPIQESTPTQSAAPTPYFTDDELELICQEAIVSTLEDAEILGDRAEEYFCKESFRCTIDPDGKKGISLQHLTPTQISWWNRQWSIRTQASSSSSRIIRTPSPMQQDDPDTPRKDNKRMAKEDLWMPDAGEVRERLEKLKLCYKCWTKGHTGSLCRKGRKNFTIRKFMNTDNFQELLGEWRRERRLKFMDENIRSQQVETEESTATPVQCNHCGQAHTGISCPVRRPYAFETEPFCPVCQQYGHTPEDCVEGYELQS